MVHVRFFAGLWAIGAHQVHASHGPRHDEHGRAVAAEQPCALADACGHEEGRAGPAIRKEEVVGFPLINCRAHVHPLSDLLCADNILVFSRKVVSRLSQEYVNQKPYVYNIQSYILYIFLTA